MSCTNYNLLIGAFIDGELFGPEREGVEAHLASCPRCVALAEDLRCIDRAAAGEEPPHVTGEEWSLLWDNVRSGPTASGRTRLQSWPVSSWRWPLAAAAAALIFTLGVAVGRGWISEPSPADQVGQLPAQGAGNGGDTAELPAGQTHPEPGAPDVFTLPFSSF